MFFEEPNEDEFVAENQNLIEDLQEYQTCQKLFGIYQLQDLIIVIFLCKSKAQQLQFGRSAATLISDAQDERQQMKLSNRNQDASSSLDLSAGSAKRDEHNFNMSNF